MLKKFLRFFWPEPKPKTERPNCFNIYPDRVAFEFMESPTGARRKFLNDGRMYHVNLVNNDNVTRLVFPYQVTYYDPKEYANATEMPCCKKFFQYQPDLFQKIAFGVMALIIGAELLTLFLLATS